MLPDGNVSCDEYHSVNTPNCFHLCNTSLTFQFHQSRWRVAPLLLTLLLYLGGKLLVFCVCEMCLVLHFSRFFFFPSAAVSLYSFLRCRFLSPAHEAETRFICVVAIESIPEEFHLLFTLKDSHFQSGGVPTESAPPTCWVDGGSCRDTKAAGVFCLQWKCSKLSHLSSCKSSDGSPAGTADLKGLNNYPICRFIFCRFTNYSGT